jgi:hypothetical protein
VVIHHSAKARNKITKTMAKPLCCASMEGGLYSGSSASSHLGSVDLGGVDPDTVEPGGVDPGDVDLGSTILGSVDLDRIHLGSIDHPRPARAASVAAKPPFST